MAGIPKALKAFRIYECTRVEFGLFSISFEASEKKTVPILSIAEITNICYKIRFDANQLKFLHLPDDIRVFADRILFFLHVNARAAHHQKHIKTN